MTVLERNEKALKKLLVTGNGHCNYWNQDQSLDHYHTAHIKLLEKIMATSNQKEILNFFEKIGIVPKIKNGYYYPYSNQAASVREALLLEAQLAGVIIKTDVLVEEVIKQGDKFTIKSKNSQYKADKVILALGSKAYFKGSFAPNIYEIVQNMGYPINTILPALVPLCGKGYYFKTWSGVRTEAQVTLYENGHMCQTETGELQLTDYGLSGICIFNLSGLVAEGLNNGLREVIKINFAPFIEGKSAFAVVNFLDKRDKKVPNRNIFQLLEGFLHYKLIKVLLKKAQIAENSIWSNLSENKKKELARMIYAFEQPIIGTLDFDRAQVCRGGVFLTEIDPYTMESLKIQGLYLTGELLDVYGDCGGYNLSFAWVSGMLAGKAIK